MRRRVRLCPPSWWYRAESTSRRKAQGLNAQILNMLGDISGPAPQQPYQGEGGAASSSLGAVGLGIEGEGWWKQLSEQGEVSPWSWWNQHAGTSVGGAGGPPGGGKWQFLVLSDLDCTLFPTTWIKSGCLGWILDWEERITNGRMSYPANEFTKKLLRGLEGTVEADDEGGIRIQIVLADQRWAETLLGNRLGWEWARLRLRVGNEWVAVRTYTTAVCVDKSIRFRSFVHHDVIGTMVFLYLVISP